MAHVCLVNAIPQNDESGGRPFGRCVEMVFWKEFRKRLTGHRSKRGSDSLHSWWKSGVAEVPVRVSGAHLGGR